MCLAGSWVPSAPRLRLGLFLARPRLTRSDQDLSLGIATCLISRVISRGLARSSVVAAVMFLSAGVPPILDVAQITGP